MRVNDFPLLEVKACEQGFDGEASSHKCQYISLRGNGLRRPCKQTQVLLNTPKRNAWNYTHTEIRHATALWSAPPASRKSSQAHDALRQ